MGAREFEMVKGAMLRIDPLAGDSLRVRSGEVWVTQSEDPNDYMLKTGDSLTLKGKGAMLAIAYKPTLLDLFRKDPLRPESGGTRGNGIFERLHSFLQGKT
jgi:DUF2917 family protein